MRMLAPCREPLEEGATSQPDSARVARNCAAARRRQLIGALDLNAITLSGG
jgi:hypothetical protein